MMTYLASDGLTGASAFSGMSFASQFSCDDEVPLITKDLVSYSFQVARGMEYLASKKVLIAFNSLLTVGVVYCGISVFAMCGKYLGCCFFSKISSN
jgi:hypothetical protein